MTMRNYPCLLLSIALLATPSPSVSDDTAAATHWSFKAPLHHTPPAVHGEKRVRNPIDRFILSRLEQNGLGLSPEASRETLIRRLSFDLRGLPPTPDEVTAFVEDKAQFAYERLVNRMLASKHHGERWARHWLDVARYADSNGYTRDFPRTIWKYRDWCIDAFNRDLPFDQFIIEQYAGDLLPDATLDQQIATGFHRNTLVNGEGGTDPEQFRVESIADRVDTTGVALLGLTLGCARCHDHKFDPISQTEYYQFFAFLNNCDEPEIDAPSREQQREGKLEERGRIRGRIAQLEKTLAQTKSEEVLAEQLAWERTITTEQRAKYPGDLQAAILEKPENRTDVQTRLVLDLFKTTGVARRAFAEIAQISKLRASEPSIPTTMVLRRRPEPRETFIHVRGSFLDRGDRVLPGVPSILHELRSQSESPTRLDLARWLVSPENPLTPRVIMNRFWMRYFGRGLVDTENDFGLQGTPPSHPELLDWLATEFVSQGWSMRAMHRLIVNSTTYRQSSTRRANVEKMDPTNRWLGRQNRLRLEAEIIRDSALAVSGLLSRIVGGPSVFPPQPDGVFDFTQDPKPWIAETGHQRYRRGMYTHLWRSSPYPALIVFDFPNSNVTCTRRPRTNTPLQALTLANDVTFLECARSLGKRVISEDFEDDREGIIRMFQYALGRKPGVSETDRLASYVTNQRSSFTKDRSAAEALSGVQMNAGELATWTSLARVLMNVDEFITRE